jgi:tetratricopeptide (TPR) repeat protein
MDDADRGRVKHLLLEALERPAQAREQFLDTACGDDPGLRAEVESLLSASEGSGALLGAGGDADAHAAPPLPERPGTIVGGRYRLVEQIGEGGFGVVFLARQEQPVRRDVALKVIKLGMDTRQVVARFRAERQALAMMDHPNVARVLDGGATDSGRPYFVAELVPGRPVTEYCTVKDLGLRERLELFIPVCHAIGHAHQRGIIHRDVKPANVLVVEQDGAAVPKVIDFGVAKSTGVPLADGASHAGAPQVVGTLEYMSPEQADPRGGAVDTRSDVYALGALLYELITGTPPLDRRAMSERGHPELWRTIREVDPVPPSKRLQASPALARSVRGDLDRVVLKCLEKDRERRYAGAGQLADDLRRYLAGEPVSAGPATTAYRVRKWAVRHKAAAAIALMACAAVVASTAGVTVGFVRARAARERAEAAERVATDRQAVAEASAAEARRQADRAVTVTELLGHVLALAESGVGPGGEDATAQDVLRRASGQITRKLRGRPEEELAARRLLAHGSQRVFLHDLAAEELRVAWELARALPAGPRHPRALDLGGDWAMAMYLAGRGADAAPRAREVLADCERVLGPAHPATWEAMQAAAVCAAERGSTAEAHELLTRLVTTARPVAAARRPERLGRYLCNWSVSLKDRGEHRAAAAALSEAAAILLGHGADGDGVAGSDPDLWPAGERAPDPVEGASWAARLAVESRVPEALPLVERIVARTLARHPQGTPSVSYRLEDVADLRLAAGDRAGAAAALERAIEVSPKPRGADGGADRARWRMWTMRCGPELADGWRSDPLRRQVFCALNDLLRDHPPPRLRPEEVRIDRLRFRLSRWPLGGGTSAPVLVGEGRLDDLRQLGTPADGTYLLALEVPRLGNEPLRRATWLLLAPWAVERRAVARFDGLRTANAPNDRDWAGVVAAEPYERARAIGLALHDGLPPRGGGPERLQWFTVSATTRLEVPEAASFRVSTTSDDGVRVWVDGRPVIDHWRPRSGGTSDAVVHLAAGAHELRVELFQETGGHQLWLQLAPLTREAKLAAAAAGAGVPGQDWAAQWAEQLGRDWPHDPDFPPRRARALARGGRFAEAAAAYGPVVDLDPSDRYRWVAWTTLLAALRRDDEYRRAVGNFADRFSETADPADLTWVLIACCVRPDVPVAPDLLGRLLDRAAGVDAHPHDLPFLCLARGMANYRTGRVPAAIPQLEQGLRLLPAEYAASRATAEFFLALAYRRQGRADDARAALARGERLVGFECRVAGAEDLTDGDLENWLVANTAYREARLAFGGS